MWLSLQPREETYSIPYVCLHSLVRLAAEVLGAEAEQEVGGRRGQKRTNLDMEHLADKGVVLHLSLSEIGQCHFCQSLQSIGKGIAAGVGCLQLETLNLPSTKCTHASVHCV